MNTRRGFERSALPEVTDARIARQWAGTEDRIAARARRAWRWPGLVAIAAACAVAVFVVRTRQTPAILVGAVVESAGEQAVSLSDGSRVDLAPKSRLHVEALEESRIELSLERGSATFDVRHLASRRFAVKVGAFDVIDEGTRFTIATDEGGEVSVAVERGTVRIERRDTAEPARFLSAGERWSAGSSASAAPPVESSHRAAAVDSHPSGAESPLEALPPVAPPTSARAQRPTAKDLLEAAQRAQREGRIRDAAAAYDRLRRDYANDPRAGLAAFELGRVRLGSLGDARGAAQAFEEAIALSPDAPFREDADARLVEAFDAAGDARRCEAARAAYLARYPKGLHAANVTSRCARTP